MGVDFSALSPHAHWELPDPFLWCAQWKYSFLLVDPRGTWWSEGDASHYLSPEEGRDGYDLVEWCASQPWCTGKVGWGGGVSYYAMSAYQVAALKPPHLAAIMVWEGISDLYREVNTQGGIPNVAFQHFWMNLTGTGLREAEDHAVLAVERPLFDGLWASKVVDWRLIDVPAMSVTGWSSLALHLRGTILAWKTFASREKYLVVHAGKEWREFYKKENILKQKAFFDCFLKNQANEVASWPPVTLDVRTDLDTFVTRAETSFPPPTTELQAFYFGNDQRLVPPNSGAVPNVAAYASYTAHDPFSSISFTHVFNKRTEIAGHASATFYVQALDYPDTDLFLALQKLDAHGNEIKFWHSTQKAEASASFGWLRASHRELDEGKSAPGFPVHKHQRRLWLRPADVVEVVVEIWPSATVWEAGETLKLVVKGSPFTDVENKTQFKGANAHNFGEVRVWYGGDYGSHLLVPVNEAQ
ncbi:Peptidase S9/S15 [Macrophomina phaseolina MS6]|uniref:Peptidase S9/S15 n=1 Tax=Macrophomina phaseolina (strain MS6) TaxID=1126212 RepID=K2RU96_MACPH|nr:Peptidase S9/S15 [Macrophomina phaseolina MS6]